MSGLLDALHQRTPLPSWAAPPAPLPVGPYPSAKWPAGLTHLPKPTDPKPERIAAVQALGVEWVVAFDIDGPHEAAHYQHGTLRALPARALLTKVKLGGVWFDATEALSEPFEESLQEALDAMEWAS